MAALTADDLTAVLADAAALLGAPLADPELLSDGQRAVVVRAKRTDDPPADAATVIVKRFRSSRPWVSGGFGYAREWAGLRCVPGAPTLYAAAPGLIVMEDVGAGPTLADLLLGTDPAAARAGLLSWAASLGAATAAGVTEVDRFRDLIRRIDPDTRTAGGPPSPDLPARALTRIRDWVTVAPRTEAEVTAAISAGRSASPLTVTAGDFCPDNVVLTATGPRMVDFEASALQHPAGAAIDVIQPFATCWCLAQLPTGLAAELEATFVAGLGDLAYVTERADWALRLQQAGATAALTMTEVTLAGLIRADQPGPPSTGRERMAYRWRWVVEHCPDLPGLQVTCGRLLERFAWGGELGLYGGLG